MEGANPHNSTHQTLEYLPQSLIDITPQVNQELPCWHNYKEEEGGKARKDDDRLGTSFTVKVGEINGNIREEKSKSKRKDLVGWM